MAFTDGQIAGSMATIAIVALVYVCSFFSPSSHRPTGPGAFLVKTSSSVAVELSGNGAGERGIYFVPEGTTVGDFLKRTEGGLPAGITRKSSGNALLPGNSLLIVRNAAGLPQCAMGEMRAARKIALGLPVNINRATYEELLLIPGIGEKTSVQIISLRQALGRINHLEELMNIRGIKEKKLARLKKYLCVDEPRQK